MRVSLDEIRREVKTELAKLQMIERLMSPNRASRPSLQSIPRKKNTTSFEEFLPSHCRQNTQIPNSRSSKHLDKTINLTSSTSLKSHQESLSFLKDRERADKPDSHNSHDSQLISQLMRKNKELEAKVVRQQELIEELEQIVKEHL